MAKKLLILSFDALAGSDYKYLKDKEEMKDFFNKASRCESVNSVYPSVTYACHTSIVTGMVPNHHRIVTNTLLQKNRVNTPDWYWQRKYIKADTFYDKFIDQGYKVAAFLWPVTAKSRINYIFPEVLPNRFWDSQVFTVLRNGTPKFVLDLFLKYKDKVDGIKQPNLDDFVTACVVDTIQNKDVDVFMVHLTDLDAQRHDYGCNSIQATQALDRLTQRFGLFVQALKDKGIYDQTNIIVLGDHHQKDFHTKVNINKLLSDHLWLLYKKDRVVDYKAIAKSNGGSCYIYRKNKNIDMSELEALLNQLKDNKDNGIKTIYKSKEIAQLGADGQADFMLEAQEGFIFSDYIGGGEKGKKADHGYLPNIPNYQTFFAIAGPDVKENRIVESMSLIDIAPTLSQIFDLKMKDMDGHAIKEFIK